MTRGMQESSKAAAEAVRSEVEAVRAQLIAPIREARRVAMMNMVAAGMAVVAAGLVLWASL
jgi:fatty acid desaturase